MPVLCLLALYLFFLFFVGFGVLSCFLPFERDSQIALLFSPLAGLVLAQLIGCWFIGFNQSFNQTTFYIPYLVLFLFSVAMIIYRRGLFVQVFDQCKNRKTDVALIVIALIGCLIVISHPLSRVGYLTCTFRIGPDGSMYAQMAQALITGNRLSTLSNDPLAFSGFLIHQRWGCPILVAEFGKFIHAQHAYQVLFLPSLASYLLCSAFIFLSINKRHAIFPGFIALGAILFLMNSNLLNSMYENQHPNILALPVITMLLLLILISRDELALKQYPWKYVGLAGFLWASLLITYSEIIPILILVFVAMASYDFCFGNYKIAWKMGVGIFISVVLGLLLAGPYSVYMLHRTVVLHAAARVGYQQPLWTMPSEMFGFMNIYSDGLSAFNFIGQPSGRHRSAMELLIGIPLSVFLIWSTAMFVGTMTKLRQSFWYSLATVIAFIFLPMYILKAGNYLYMKTYVTLLPLLFIVVWDSIWAFAIRRLTSRSAKVLIATVSILTVGSGLNYIWGYERLGGHIPEGFMTLSHQNWNPDVVLLPERRGDYDVRTRFLDRTREMYFAPLFRPVWVDQWLEGQDIQPGNPLLMKSVALIIRRQANQQSTDRTLYADQEYIIIDTRMPLQMGIQFQRGSRNIQLYKFWRDPLITKAVSARQEIVK